MYIRMYILLFMYAVSYISTYVIRMYCMYGQHYIFIAGYCVNTHTYICTYVCTVNTSKFTCILPSVLMHTVRYGKNNLTLYSETSLNRTLCNLEPSIN